MTLSVVLPVVDDEKRVPEALRRIGAFLSLKAYPWEILVCDTGSAGSARDSVESFKRQNTRIPVQYLHSPGTAIIGQGVLAASGRYVLLTESGLPTPIKEVDKLIDALEKGADVAIGSRALHAKDCDVRQSVFSRVSEGLQNLVVRATMLPKIRDARCRFKCFRNDAAKNIFAQRAASADISGVAALRVASKAGLRIAEVPVMWSREKA